MSVNISGPNVHKSRGFESPLRIVFSPLLTCIHVFGSVRAKPTVVPEEHTFKLFCTNSIRRQIFQRGKVYCQVKKCVTVKSRYMVSIAQLLERWQNIYARGTGFEFMTVLHRLHFNLSRVVYP